MENNRSFFITLSHTFILSFLGVGLFAPLIFALVFADSGGGILGAIEAGILRVVSLVLLVCFAIFWIISSWVRHSLWKDSFSFTKFFLLYVIGTSIFDVFKTIAPILFIFDEKDFLRSANTPFLDRAGFVSILVLEFLMPIVLLLGIYFIIHKLLQTENRVGKIIVAVLLMLTPWSLSTFLIPVTGSLLSPIVDHLRAEDSARILEESVGLFEISEFKEEPIIDKDGTVTAFDISFSLKSREKMDVYISSYLSPRKNDGSLGFFIFDFGSQQMISLPKNAPVIVRQHLQRSVVANSFSYEEYDPSDDLRRYFVEGPLIAIIEIQWGKSFPRYYNEINFSGLTHQESKTAVGSKNPFSFLPMLRTTRSYRINDVLYPRQRWPDSKR